jgi:hypothetical protein
MLQAGASARVPQGSPGRDAHPPIRGVEAATPAGAGIGRGGSGPGTTSGA